MALPLTRNTTYTPGAPVKSADLNALQDDQVGGLHGAKWINYPPIGPADTTTVRYGGDGQIFLASNGITYVRVAIPVEPGMTITKCAAWMHATDGLCTVEFLENGGPLATLVGLDAGGGTYGRRVESADFALAVPASTLTYSLSVVAVIKMTTTVHRCWTVAVRVQKTANL